MYRPADVADAIHEAIKHSNESQCGRPHVARNLLYLTWLRCGSGCNELVLLHGERDHHLSVTLKIGRCSRVVPVRL